MSILSRTWTCSEETNDPKARAALILAAHRIAILEADLKRLKETK